MSLLAIRSHIYCNIIMGVPSIIFARFYSLEASHRFHSHFKGRGSPKGVNSSGWRSLGVTLRSQNCGHGTAVLLLVVIVKPQLHQPVLPNIDALESPQMPKRMSRETSNKRLKQRNIQTKKRHILLKILLWRISNIHKNRTI